MIARHLADAILMSFAYEDIEEICVAAKGVKHEAKSAFYYQFGDDSCLHFDHVSKEWSAET